MSGDAGAHQRGPAKSSCPHPKGAGGLRALGIPQSPKPRFPGSTACWGGSRQLCLGVSPCWVTTEMPFRPNKTQMSFGLFSKASKRGRWGRGGKKGGRGGDPFVPDAGCSHIYHYGNKSPPHAGCLGDGNRTGNSSRHPQRAMGEGEGTGRERTPLCTPPAPASPPSSGLCLQAGIGFLLGTMPGPRRRGAEDWLVPSLVPLTPLGG